MSRRVKKPHTADRYADRKRLSIEAGRAALLASGDAHALRFIADVARHGHKLDDLFDALNMALYRGRNDYKGPVYQDPPGK